MKKILRYLLILIGIIVISLCGFAAFIAARGIPKYKAQTVEMKIEYTAQRVTKGLKLASMLCSNCHLDPATAKFTGRRMQEAGQFGDIYSKNITHHPDNNIMKWTDGQLAYLLRTGIKPDGTYLPPYMPKLAHLSDEDLYSVISFLRSDHPWLQADAKKQPDTKPSFLTKFLTNIGVLKPFPYPTAVIPEPDTANAVTWGRYIALNQLECFACHSRDFAKNDYFNPEKSPGFFGGGNELQTGDGKKIYSLNITMDEETGIGKWTEEEFVKALRFGQVPGRQASLRPPMSNYGNLTDQEAKAIYAYLKTIPKINNKVERNL